MALVDSSVVRCNDDDGLLIDACLLQRSYDLSYIAVEYFHLCQIFRRAMAYVVSLPVRMVIYKCEQLRLEVFDVFAGKGSDLCFCLLYADIPDARIYEWLDAIPLMDSDALGWRYLLMHEGEDRWKISS